MAFRVFSDTWHVIIVTRHKQDDDIEKQSFPMIWK